LASRYSFTRRTVTPALLPDPDCPHSYFDRCRFVGDFAVYDWRDWTLLDTNLTGVTALPPARKLEFICSRRSDWPVGIIPDAIPLHNHDLSAAWYSQAALSETGQTQTMLNRLATAHGDYSLSVANFFYDLKTTTAVTDATIKTIARTVFANSPDLLEAAERYKARIGEPPVPDMTTDLTDLHVMFSREGRRRLDISSAIRATKDRWLLKRHLETLYPDVRFWVQQIEPVLTLYASDRRAAFADEEFWFGFLMRRR